MKTDPMPLNNENIGGFIDRISEFVDALKLAGQNKRWIALLPEELNTMNRVGKKMQNGIEDMT